MITEPVMIVMNDETRPLITAILQDVLREPVMEVTPTFGMPIGHTRYACGLCGVVSDTLAALTHQEDCAYLFAQRIVTICRSAK